MSKQYHFRCTTNPNAPVLTVGTPLEAKEMRNHPDYEEISALGELVEREDELDGSLPFHGQGRRK